MLNRLRVLIDRRSKWKRSMLTFQLLGCSTSFESVGEETTPRTYERGVGSTDVGSVTCTPGDTGIHRYYRVKIFQLIQKSLLPVPVKAMVTKPC